MRLSDSERSAFTHDEETITAALTPLEKELCNKMTRI